MHGLYVKYNLVVKCFSGRCYLFVFSVDHVEQGLKEWNPDAAPDRTKGQTSAKWCRAIDVMCT